jgi:hypothetical protein
MAVDAIFPIRSRSAVISTSAPAVLQSARQVRPPSSVNRTITGVENDDPSPDQSFVETNVRFRRSEASAV